MMKKNTGKPSEQQFDAYFARFGKQASVTKFTDQSTLHGVNRGKKVKAPAAPCDRLVVHRGRTFFAEIKSSLSETSFPFSSFQKSQIAKAIEVVAAGGEYFVFLHKLKDNTWFQVPWYVIAIERAKGKMSIKWVDLEPYLITMEPQ